MPKGSTCKARGCISNKTDNPELSFHSFPKDKERFRKWCDLIKRPDLNHSKVITNRMSMRVCSLHFEDNMYMSSSNKSRLIWCAVPKPVGAMQDIDSTVLAQPLPLAKGNKKFDWSLTLDEEVIIKEENMMEHENHLDLSPPPSPEADSPSSFYADTKEGIIKHDNTDTTEDCTDYSLFLSPSGNASSHGSDTEEDGNSRPFSQRGNKCMDEVNASPAHTHLNTSATGISAKIKSSDPMSDASASVSVTSADGFMQASDETSSVCQTSEIMQVPSRVVRDSLPTLKLSSNEDAGVASLLLPEVKEEPVRSSGASLDEIRSEEETNKFFQSLEDALRPYQPTKAMSPLSVEPSETNSTPLPSSTAQLFSPDTAPLTTTEVSQCSDLPIAATQSSDLPFVNPLPSDLPCMTTQSNDLPYATTESIGLPYVATQTIDLPFATESEQTGTSLSSSIYQSCQLNTSPSSSLYTQTGTTVNSSLSVEKPTLTSSQSSMVDAAFSPTDTHHVKKLCFKTSRDEGPIVVDEDDVSIVDDRDDPECEKNCQCSKYEEKIDKTSLATTKPASQVHRTYSGPIKRQVVKTKGGGKRTFMILNKASLKVLQAKGLIQPLKKFAESQPSSGETLLPSVQSVQNKSKIQYHSVGSMPVSLSDGSPPLFENASVSPSISGSPARASHASVNQQLTLSNKTSCSLPQLPVVVTWSATNGTDTPSFTFTIQLPPVSNQSSNTPQTPLQIVTPPVFIGGSQPTFTQFPNQVNSCLPNANKVTGTNQNFQDKNQSSVSRFLKAEMETAKMQQSFAVTHSVMSSCPRSKNSLYTNIVANDSCKYSVQSPIMSTQFPLVASETPGDHIIASHNEIDLSVNDLEDSNDYLSSGPSSPLRNAEEVVTSKKPETKSTPIGFASGPCKFRKGGLKMYRYVNMPDGGSKVGPKSTQNVRWVALPTVPVNSGQPLTSRTLEQVITSSLQQNTRQENQGTGKTRSSAEPLSDLTAAIYEGFPIGTMDHKGASTMHPSPYKSANRELKMKYARLLNKHRQRYHLLLKKYKALENKFAVVEDAGTPEQVIRDARNFLSEEHVLFLESQMFLRNRPGTGNRFSKKFMGLMIEYYKRSAAGYRFLRTIFTIPSVKTVQKWLSKPLHIREDEENDQFAIPMQREQGTANGGESNVEASCSGLRKPQSTSNDEHVSGERRDYSQKFSQGRSTPDESDMEEGSSEDYDSEDFGLEEMDEEEMIQENETTKKRIPVQSSQGSNERDITIQWEDEPWPTVDME
ncbi:uncharacterized protein [Cherax quadricarinatus]|uniref:uncharacterized protein isoform X2 n=1 Tax=Cherax quadricarinatus TaxID=27406 RepID=UPI00387E315E